jgi:hypothetical protein
MTKSFTNGTIFCMKAILKLILLSLFGLAVFLPMKGIVVWFYWLLYILMGLVLVLYYYVAYWVSKKAVEPYIKGFSLFVSLVPPISSEDYVRGRLVVTKDKVALYQKLSLTKVLEVWSIETSKISSYTLEKVLASKKVITFVFDDSKQRSFISKSISKKEKELKEALGWS